MIILMIIHAPRMSLEEAKSRFIRSREMLDVAIKEVERLTEETKKNYIEYLVTGVREKGVACLRVEDMAETLPDDIIMVDGVILVPNTETGVDRSGIWCVSGSDFLSLGCIKRDEYGYKYTPITFFIDQNADPEPYIREYNIEIEKLRDSEKAYKMPCGTRILLGDLVDLEIKQNGQAIADRKVYQERIPLSHSFMNCVLLLRKE